jgi:ABC-type glycerol-3-phosphate transport system permease component
MLPSQVTMIPLFLIFTRIGWVNTLRPLWIGAFFAPAFYVFLLRQFFLTIPKDLEDAAKIDGCGYFGIYARVMLPLIKPAVISVVIFQFMAAWNDFLGPLIYIQDRDLATLSLALQAFQSIHGAEWSLLMAACTMMILPVIALFLAAQRYFIQGVTLTGLKA